MRLFSEKVQPTFTNSDYNILTVEDFTEIFFDVYEFEISGKKFIAEKVAEYKGFPVVDIPLVLEGNKFNAPFILERGEFCVYYNPNNSTFISVAEEDKGEPILELEEVRDEVEEIIFERKEDILAEIQEARDSAAKFAESIRQQKLYQADTELVLKRERFSDELNITKAGLVEEFLGIIEGAKSEIYNFTESEQTKLAEYVVKHINKLSDTLVTEIEQKSLTAEQTFNTKLDELAANILTTAVVKEAAASRKHYDSVIKEKYQAISANVDKLVSEKIEALKADSQVELKAIEKTSFDAIFNVNTNINKALSRVGTVKAQLNEALTTKAKELQDSITLAQDRISEYYDTKLQSIDSKIDNVTDEVKQQAIKLVEESKQSLLEAIDNIKVDVPNIIIEQKNGTSQEIDLKKVKKELEKTVTTKFTNEMMSLKRMIEMMSGGGSVAQQFANGGTMNGDLNVTSRILSGGVDLATLFSGGGVTGAYLPLSGGTITGNLTANSFVTLNGLSSQFVKGDGSLDDTQYLTAESLNSNVILYPTTAASDLSATYKLVASLTDPDYDIPAVDISTGSITTDEKLVGTLASEAGIIVGNPGVINVTVLGNIRKTAGSSSSAATFHFHVYKRSSSGTLTLIGISDNTLPSTNAVYAQFSTSLIANFGDWVATDRLVVEFYAQRVVGGGNPTYDFQYGGDTPVRILLPLPTSVLLSDYVPYTGATANLNLGSNTMIATNILVYNDIDASTGNIYGKFSRLQPVGYSSNIALEVDDIDANTRFTVTGNGDVSAQGNIESAGTVSAVGLDITGQSNYTGGGVTFNYDAAAITQHRNALLLGTTNSPTFSSVSASNLVYRDGNTNTSALTIGTNDAYALNFETNGVTRMSVLSGGVILTSSGGASTTSPGLALGATDVGFSSSAGQLTIINAGAACAAFVSGSIKVPNIGFTSSVAGAGPDLFLERDATNVLAQKRGTNTQEFRLYNTYTSATSAERATFKFVNNDFVIGSETLPLSGPQRSIIIAPGYNVSLSATAPIIIPQTWNNSANTFTLLSANVTDTASSGSSLLMDLQVGGSSKFKVDKNGLITTTNGLMSNSILYLGSYNNQYAAGLYSNGDLRASIIRAGLGNNSPSFTADANDIMAQRNGLTSQTFNLYNTYTSATSAERATFKFDANRNFVIGAETLPLSGPQRSMLFQTASATRMTILSSGNVGIGVANPTGKLVIDAPNSGTNRNLVFEQSTGSSAQVNEIVWRSSSGSIFDYAKIKTSYGTSYLNSYFTIQVASSAQVLQDRFHINTVGNVGIGTVLPSEALTVVGNISATGTVTSGGLSITGQSNYTGGGVTFNYDAAAVTTHRNSLGLGTTQSPTFSGLSSTGTINAAAGSNAVPSINFGNPSTGIYQQASDRIGFTVGGSLKMVVYSSGTYMNTGAAFGINTANWFRIGTGGVELTTTTGGGTYAPLTISNLSASGTVTTGGLSSTGDIEITDSTKGIILRSPNGTRWRVTVNDAGLLTPTSI